MPKKKTTPKTPKFNKTQLKAIEMLSAIPSQYKNYEDLCQNHLKIDRRTLYEWRQSDDFMKEVNKLTDKNYRAMGGEVRKSLIAQVKKGNPALIKLFLEHAEGFVPKSKVEQTNISMDDIERKIAEADEQEYNPITDDE